MGPSQSGGSGRLKTGQTFPSSVSPRSIDETAGLISARPALKPLADGPRGLREPLISEAEKPFYALRPTQPASNACWPHLFSKTLPEVAQFGATVMGLLLRTQLTGAVTADGATRSVFLTSISDSHLFLRLVNVH